MPIKISWIKKLKEARATKPMTTFLLVLLVTIVVSSFVFAISLFRLSLEDADFWLKALSALLASMIFAVGLAALITGHFVNERLTAKVLRLENEGDKIRTGLTRAITDLDRRQVERENVQPYARIIKMSCLTHALGQRPNADPPPDVPVRVLHEQDFRRTAESFASKIWLSLSIAGWRVTGSSSEALPLQEIKTGRQTLSNIGSFGPTGLLISPRERFVKEGSAEDRLIKALMTCGAKFEVTEPLSSDTIFLIVGPIP